MRLIKMTGGLGNQMFIYAMFLRMKKHFPHTRIDISDMVHYHVHHGYEMNTIFNLPHDEFCISQPLKKILEFLFFKTILERKQHGSLTPYRNKHLWPLVYFKGFYQSERYFDDIKEEVRRAFTFDTQKANAQTLRMKEHIETDPFAVSLHVRRGDYLEPEHWNAIGCVCQLSYYQHALAEMERLVPDASYYVFSDDLEWVKQHLHLSKATYIDWNRGSDSWQDMMLMSCCRHHIICNSTFSWWGAWLNPRQDKQVLVPDRWFNNAAAPFIYPAGWVKVATR